MTQKSTKELFMELMTKLSSTAVLGSVPLSCLLIGLEALMAVEFSCPCRIKWNHTLSNLVIIAPACFAFVLMYLWLRPCGCKITSWKCDSSVLFDETIQNSVMGFLRCLIPPVVWFFLVLYDGNYYACSQTDWVGVYVPDKELGRKWCKPTDVNLSIEFQLRNTTQGFVDWSQYAGYIVLVDLCAVTFVLECVYDCCKNYGKGQQTSEEEEMNPIRSDIQPQIIHVKCSVNDISLVLSTNAQNDSS